MIREDNTLGVWFREGATFTIHKDGTRIYTRGDDFIVEKDGYAPVRIYRCSGGAGFDTQFAPTGLREDANTPEEEIYSGAPLDVRERAFGGRITEALLPDKTHVTTFKEAVNGGLPQTVHLVARPD